MSTTVLAMSTIRIKCKYYRGPTTKYQEQTNSWLLKFHNPCETKQVFGEGLNHSERTSANPPAESMNDRSPSFILPTACHTVPVPSSEHRKALEIECKIADICVLWDTAVRLLSRSRQRTSFVVSIATCDPMLQSSNGKSSERRAFTRQILYARRLQRLSGTARQGDCLGALYCLPETLAVYPYAPLERVHQS
jgi:hypothetical protein